MNCELTVTHSGQFIIKKLDLCIVSIEIAFSMNARTFIFIIHTKKYTYGQLKKNHCLPKYKCMQPTGWERERAHANHRPFIQSMNQWIQSTTQWEERKNDINRRGMARAIHTGQRLIAKQLSNLLLLLFRLTEAILVSQHSIIIIMKEKNIFSFR